MTGEAIEREAQARVIVRDARADDAGACAGILNAWIDETRWMPRVHAPEDVERHYREFVFRNRRIWVAGDPVAGYLAMDEAESEITSLYAARPGQGVGRALLDRAEVGRDRLWLWTFVANEGARRFYAREGFAEVDRTDGDNEEGLPDVRFLWERGA